MIRPLHTRTQAALRIQRRSKTLDGASIDGPTFDATFLVTDDGKTLSMPNAVPEPSTFALGLLSLGWYGRRRHGRAG